MAQVRRHQQAQGLKLGESLVYGYLRKKQGKLLIKSMKGEAEKSRHGAVMRCKPVRTVSDVGKEADCERNKQWLGGER